MANVTHIHGHPIKDVKAHEDIKAVKQHMQELGADLDGVKSRGIGNGGFDPSVSPNVKAPLFRTEKNVINHASDETCDNAQGVNPDILIQKRVEYQDDNPTADENIKYPGMVYSEMLVHGHTLNSEEANSQQISNVYSTTQHMGAGLFGVAGSANRVFLPDSTVNPQIKLLGAPKGVAVEGQVFSDTEYEYGGYALGAEFNLFDRCKSGTAPVYNNSDSLQFTRCTGVLNLIGGGYSQPVSYGMRIGSFGGYPSGMWNGIIVGGQSMKINNTPGVKGTVGVNFGSWNEGAHGDIAIKFGIANRHLWFKNGAKIAASIVRMIPNDSTVFTQFAIGMNPGGGTQLIFAEVSDKDANNPTYTTRGFIESKEMGMRILTKWGSVKIGTDDGTGNQIEIDSAGMYPTKDNVMFLGLPAVKYANAYLHKLTIGSTTITETQLQALLAKI